MVDHRLTETSGLTHASAATPEVLPDFCDNDVLLRVLIFAVLLGVVLAMVRGLKPDPLIATGLSLLFVTWVAMSTLLVLCLVQRWLRRSAVYWQILIPPLITLMNTAGVHFVAEQFQLADADLRLHTMGVALLVSLIAVHYLYLLAAWKDEVQVAAHAREQALRARVRPHFLFNSLNTIADLCRSEPSKAETITLDLADLFRAAFEKGPTHPLQEELELIRSYLAIEEIRFGNRLQLEWDTSSVATADIHVPTLALQPLVENAVQHGIAPSADGGKIWVRTRDQGTSVVLTIGNTLAPAHTNGTQTAGSEARARLNQFFGSRADVRIRRGDGQYEMDVILPLKPDPKGDQPCRSVC